MTQKKVIIVEDDKNLCSNLVELLSLEGFLVDGVNCALDFFQRLSSGDYDIAIVDIGLPDKSGFEVVQHLREHTGLGIAILTAKDGLQNKIKGYEAGADLYFVKPVDYRELAASLKNLHLRLAPEVKGQPQECSARSWGFDAKARELISPGGVSIKLTTKEFAFLECLTQGGGQPVPRSRLMVALGYSDEGPYGNRALDVMVVRLRKKIREISSEEPPIHTEHSFGFRFSSLPLC